MPLWGGASPRTVRAATIKPFAADTAGITFGYQTFAADANSCDRRVREVGPHPERCLTAGADVTLRLTGPNGRGPDGDPGGCRRPATGDGSDFAVGSAGNGTSSLATELETAILAAASNAGLTALVAERSRARDQPGHQHDLRGDHQHRRRRRGPRLRGDRRHRHRRRSGGQGAGTRLQRPCLRADAGGRDREGRSPPRSSRCRRSRRRSVRSASVSTCRTSSWSR